MTAPQFAAVDEDTADLLSVIADDGTQQVDREWEIYKQALHSCAALNKLEPGVINPNWLRTVIAGRVKPQRCGAFAHRALSQGLVEYTGEYVISDDRKGRNSGKPLRVIRLLSP